MSGHTLRLFVAIYPPEEARRAMLRALTTLHPPPDARHRVTPIEHLHMTAQFIGETNTHELDEVTVSVHRSAAGIGPFSLTPARLITLPERGMPRLIAMETDAPPQLLEIHRRLAQRLARTPRAKSGDRFLPHFTLCRFTSSARPAALEQPVTLDCFQISSVSLIRSDLRPTGAVHSILTEIPLE